MMPNFDCDDYLSNDSLHLDDEHNDDDLPSGNGEDADVGDNAAYLYSYHS